MARAHGCAARRVLGESNAMRVANPDAAGALGRRVAERLARSGVPQRLIVQGDAVAPDVPGAEVARIGGYAAVAAGVGRIVYSSFVGAAADASFTLARDHSSTEERIRSAGVPFTFLRGGPYFTSPSRAASSTSWPIRGPASPGTRPCRLRSSSERIPRRTTT
jgi:uncharacterized protein YbjT (DUF2867 family)